MKTQSGEVSKVSTIPLTKILKKNPPYADTEVPYEVTKAKINVLLKSYGAIGTIWTSVVGLDEILEFGVDVKVDGVVRRVTISISPPHIFVKKRVNGKNVDTENLNQEYRLMYYWIKSKLEAVFWGLSTIEREFLSNIQLSLADGRVSTVGDIVTGLMSKGTMQSLPFYGSSQTTTGPRNITPELPSKPRNITPGATP